MNPEIKISKLDPTDRDLILKIANWYFEEWNTPIERTIQRLTNQPDDDVLFQLFLTVGDRAVATGGLCNQVNLLLAHKKFTKFKPWVAMLYTEKEYRNQGLGQALLERIEWFAKAKGLAKIYLYTFTAESLYRRCGWIPIDRVDYKDHDTVVMEKGL